MADAHFELRQDGQRVAAVSGTRSLALASIQHYAMVYGQDGPVEIRERVGKRWKKLELNPPKDGAL